MLKNGLLPIFVILLVVGCKPEKLEPKRNEPITYQDPLLHGKWKKVNSDDSITEYLIFKDKDSSFSCCALYILKNGMKWREYASYYIDANFELHFPFYKGTYKVRNDSLSIYDENKLLKYLYTRNDDSVANEYSFIKRIFYDKTIVLYSRSSLNEASFAIDENYIYPMYYNKIYKVNLLNPNDIDSFKYDFMEEYDGCFQYNGKFIFNHGNYGIDTNRLFITNAFNGNLTLFAELGNVKPDNISYDDVNDIYYIFDEVQLKLYTLQNNVLKLFFSDFKNNETDILFLGKGEFLVCINGYMLYKIKIENNTYRFVETYEFFKGNLSQRPSLINHISINKKDIWATDSEKYPNGYQEFVKIRLEE